MEANSNDIEKLYNSIKSKSCVNPDCVEEIKKLELMINYYNNQSNNSDRYWTYQYSFDKQKLELIRKEYFSRWIWNKTPGGYYDLVEKRPFR